MSLGWLVSVLVLLPNLLWMLFPPRGAPPAESTPKTRLARLMEGLEWAGRLGCFIIPFFCRVEMQSDWQWGALVTMGLALSLYYAGWTRYFMRGRSYRLLFEPLLAVPLPLATGPVIYFLAAAMLLGSWPLGMAAVALSAGHLYVTYHSFQDVRRRKPAL